MDKKEIRAHIQELLNSQLLAALSTQRNGQPYANLIAFACADTLKTILFATTKPTRKYTNLLADNRVSILVDCRSNQQADFHQASAVTLIGEAHETSSDERDTYKPIFIGRHPYLEKFVTSPTTALFKVTVKHYIMVSHFQKVMELHLTNETDLFT
ncbi:MAG: pyridoxamine 5'-phosphate oxidase family protein [Proteobacteria bacterium]|nr:pyridoxamine 5'-phosphate oxidase family protein [Pseudomonadota bacterium]MBU1057829.1 pyridoxamine 5'-phosphate oxidase family protein [Pseudomonadota bacterium]